MKKIYFFSFLFSLIILYLSYGIYLSNQVLTADQTSLYVGDAQPKYYDVKGILNLHSKAGLGSGSTDDIVSAAKKSNVDFVVITDVNIFGTADYFSGYKDNVLVLQGGRYSYLSSQLLYLPDTPSKLRFSGLGKPET